VQYVICYDIADDARRSRISTLLLDYGSRVQESVFVAHLDSELARRMRQQLDSAVNPDLDRVNVYEMCEACVKREWVLGQAKIVEDEVWYVI
jgi:CRISPR-associated protein Cas2